jgi:hypothetical protein
LKHPCGLCFNFEGQLPVIGSNGTLNSHSTRIVACTDKI